MVPEKSYIIWFTPRTGSIFLCDLLEQCKVAGQPGEFFNKDDDQSLLDHYSLQNYPQLCDHLWSLGCSPNGVMVMKYSLYHSSYESISWELARFQSLSPAHGLDWQILADLFPACKHIYLTRRNKIGLVVSWWKAIQDGQWHLRGSEKKLRSNALYQDKYNAEALTHLLKDHNLRESVIQEYFNHNQIMPYILIYEDLILDVENELSKLLRF